MNEKYTVESGANHFYIVNRDTGKYVAKSIGDSEEAYDDISFIANLLNEAARR